MLPLIFARYAQLDENNGCRKMRGVHKATSLFVKHISSGVAYEVWHGYWAVTHKKYESVGGFTHDCGISNSILSSWTMGMTALQYVCDEVDKNFLLLLLQAMNIWASSSHPVTRPAR